jgi:hypothetical protein
MSRKENLLLDLQLLQAPRPRCLLLLGSDGFPVLPADSELISNGNNQSNADVTENLMPKALDYCCPRPCCSSGE